MKPTHCPQCGSHRVHRSRRRSVLESLAGFAGRITRCHACGARALQMAGCAVRVEALQRTTECAGLALALAAAAVLVLAAILWIARLSFPAPPSLLLPGVAA